MSDPDNLIKELEVVYFIKRRKQAGIVDSVELDKVALWSFEKGKLNKIKLPSKKKKSIDKCVVIYSDDMIDTGGTAGKDIEFLKTYYPATKLNVFVATHPVFSKGLRVLDMIGADLYLLGNTLSPYGLRSHWKVRLVDISSSITDALGK